MAEYRIEKVNSLPNPLTASTVYYVANGDFTEVYVSNNDGTSAKKVNVVHNDTFDKQGGDGTNFFHLGEEDYDNLQEILNPSSDPNNFENTFNTDFFLWDTIYANDIFVIFPTSGTRFLTSTDGINFTERNLPSIAGGFVRQSTTTYNNVLAFGNGIFVAIPVGGSEILTSNDGILWNIVTPTVKPNGFNITFGAGLFVMVGDDFFNNIFYTSPNGINWTERIMSGSTNILRDIIYENNSFLAVGQSTFKTSSDGITWSDVSINNNIVWQDVTYGNNLYVVVGGNPTTSGRTDKCMTSTDGINWTERNMPVTGAWVSVSYGSGLYIAVRESLTDSIAYSVNGIDWFMTNPSIDKILYNIAFGKNTFVVVGGFFNSSTGLFEGYVFSNTFNKILNHSQLNLDDGRNPHGTRYEDILGTPPSSDRNIDGGSANTVYLPSQNIDGGGA
jgi:hypothetical protein